MVFRLKINYLGKTDFKNIKKMVSKVTKLINKIRKSEKDKNKFLSLTFTDDSEIKKLNRKYRKLNRATDVLAFPLGEDNILGDVVISVDTARRNAKRFEQSFESEIKRLVVHGILHLLGYNHKMMGNKEKCLEN